MIKCGSNGNADAIGNSSECIEDEAPYAHNGSLVRVNRSAGTITYADPKASLAGSVSRGTVIFRGVLGDEGITGVAYTYKRGCAPAPYPVRGMGYSNSAQTFVLIGAAPVRDKRSCAILGYSEDTPNAVLRFEPGTGAPD